VVACGGASLFAESLAYFLYSHLVTFAESTSGPIAASAIVVNLGLFSVFALHHSVFVRERVRATVARTVPAALERSVYVYIASVLFIVVCASWRPVAGVAWQLDGAAAWPLYALQMWGIWLSVRSAAVIDIWELAGIRQLEPARPKADRGTFKTVGPYGWVRHPIYSGWFLIVFTATPMTTTRLAFAVISSAYVLIAIPFEEKSLRTSAGAAYEDYMRRVKWKLVPGVY
jgi:protein-S-isoprenylcysteine O-methyltransferase Ste14